MKHIFYICDSVENTLGLEKILTFYNIVVLEKTDGLDDYSYTGNNIFLAEDITSQKLKDYIDELSYGEKPEIITDNNNIKQNLSEIFDSKIKLINRNLYNSDIDSSLVFNVYKIDDEIIFSNIHRIFIKQYNNYSIEVLDWNEDYISQVNDLVQKLNNIENGYSTITCKVNKEKNLEFKKIENNTIARSIDIFTRQQIKSNETPFIIYEFFNDLTSQDHLNFDENFKIQNPVSQNHPYPLTKINIRTNIDNQIKNDFPSGIWKYGGDNTGKIEHECVAIYPIDEDGDKTLCLMHRGFSIYDVEGMEGFVINTKSKDKLLKSGDIVASISMSFSALNQTNDLNAWVYEVINALLRYQMKESKVG